MKRSMRIILDANEYIFGMPEDSQEFYSIELLRIVDELLKNVPLFQLFIPEIIRKEVQRNMPRRAIPIFYNFMFSNTKIVYSSIRDVPPDFIDKYTELGLKTEDALIAAFADWKGVHFIISENRHFYEQLKVEKFVTCSAEEFLHLLKSGEIWKIIEQLETRQTLNPKEENSL